MPATRPGVCRSCGKPMLWATSLNSGKAAPLDPEPVEDGNVYLARDGTCKTLSKEQAETARVEGYRLYKSHFATCVSAAQHRKPKPEDKPCAPTN